MSIGLFRPMLWCASTRCERLALSIAPDGERVPCGTTTFAPPAMLRTGVAWVAWRAGAWASGHSGPESDRLGRWN
jgi:hypothetical protein